MGDSKQESVLSDDQVAEIEAVNKVYRVDWRHPRHREHIDALCATVRVLRDELEVADDALENQVALISELQSQLAQVTQERDDYRERLLKATETEVEI